LNELTVFTYEGNAIRTVQIDSEPWWALKDICDVLELTNSRMVAERLDDDEKGVSITDTLGGKQEITIISESGLYNTILLSRKPEAKNFKRWVTHEVLPAIRKHGLYATDELLNNPDIMIRVLQELKAERAKAKVLTEKADAQQQQIAEMTSKVLYCDIILACKDAVPISVIAKDYGWSAKRMNLYLHDCGVQYKQGDIWLLYQDYAESGYTCTRTRAYVSDGGEQHAKPHTYWTQAGRRFIYGLLKEKGVLPVIERGLLA
jgi:prophage antirepressor-like protein